jgi:predicted aconitase with swiveling domain
MKAHHCCETAGGLVAGAILVLMPKCPACLAAYALAVTGLGLSLPTATIMRMSLLILSVGAIVYPMARCLPRFAGTIQQENNKR